MAKKILIVTQHFWPENFRINDIVEAFLEKGIAVDVLCGLPNYPHGEWFEGYNAKGPMKGDYKGATLYRCGEIPRKGNTSLRIFLNYISYPITASFRLFQLSGGYDAILCYNTSPVLMSFPAILAARKFRAPLTNYVLDIWPENLYSVLNIQNKWLRKIATFVSDWHYRQADRLIALSTPLEKRLNERVGTQNPRSCTEHEKKYAIIPQYCEDFYACPSRAPRKQETVPSEPSPFTIMFAGNFSPAQSLSTALQALAILEQDGTLSTAPIQLRLVGDGMSREALEQEVKDLQLEHYVTFYGSVPPQAIPELCNSCDALLISLSSSDDLGLTIPAKMASCMAANLPLLVSMDGEGATAARESGGALVSAAQNADFLAHNMKTLATLSPEKRTAMGQACYHYYETHYRREHLIGALIDFIF